MTLGALNVLDARFDDCGGVDARQAVLNADAESPAGNQPSPQSPFLLDLDDRRELPSFRPLLLILIGAALSLAIGVAGFVQ